MADSTTIQTLIFSKPKFDAAKAQAWAKKHDFASASPDVTDSSVRIRQKSPGAFKPGSLRTIALTAGVKAVVGKPKEQHVCGAPCVAEDIVLRGSDDETIADFMEDLREALEHHFGLDEAGEHWYVRDVASDWLVLALSCCACESCTCEVCDGNCACERCEHYCPLDTDLYKVDYSRAPDGKFTFGDPVEVEAHTVYTPADGPEGEEAGGGEAAQAFEVTTDADVPKVAGAGGKKRRGKLAKRAVLPTVGGTTTVGEPGEQPLATAGQGREAASYAKMGPVTRAKMSRTAKKQPKHPTAAVVNTAGMPGGAGESEGEPKVATEAVENPTDAQRKDLPDSAFAIVYKDGNTTQKKLPHHVNTVKDGSDNATVDLPRLRNALARGNQIKGVPKDVLAKGIAHIEKHAKALKVGKQAEAALEVLQLAYEARVAHDLKELFDGDAYEVKLEAVERGGVTEAEQAAGYLAVYEGRGAVGGKINANRRLYGKPKMRENVERLAARIAAGEAVWGEADHPESSPRLLASCTKLLAVSYDEQSGDVRIRVGVVPTSAGQDVAVLMRHEMRIGVSTRSVGYARDLIMGEGDEYYAANVEHDGREYKRIDDFEIQAFDLVRQPSAGTFLGESMTPESLRAEVERITSANANTESEMTKEQFEAEIKKMDPAALKAAAPELHAAVVEAASAEVAAKLAKQAKQHEGADAAKLAEQLKEQNGKVAVLEQFVADLKAERDAAKLAEAKRAKMDEKLAGVDKADACRRYLAIHYLGDPKAAVESIDALVEQFKATFAEHLGERERVPAGRGRAPAKPGEEPAWMREDEDILGSKPLTRAPAAK